MPAPPLRGDRFSRSAAAPPSAPGCAGVFGILLNPLFPTLPLRTLAANLGGGLLMGCAMELASRHSMMTPEMRLLATTEFLGGLTTFSTFSAEITTLLLRREWLWGAIGIASHVVGSILLTIIGILLMRAAIFVGRLAMKGTLLRFYVHENRSSHHILLLRVVARAGEKAGYPRRLRVSRDRRLRAPRHSARGAFFRVGRRSRRSRSISP